MPFSMNLRVPYYSPWGEGRKRLRLPLAYRTSLLCERVEFLALTLKSLKAPARVKSFP